MFGVNSFWGTADGIIMLVIVIYLIGINLYATRLTVRDKELSKKEGARRIPEKTLFIAAALGGSVGMLSTMKRIRHKTKHKRFMIGIPLIMVCQAALIAGAVYLYLTVQV